jgi:hypothetical protein
MQRSSPKPYEIPSPEERYSTSMPIAAASVSKLTQRTRREEF